MAKKAQSKKPQQKESDFFDQLSKYLENLKKEIADNVPNLKNPFWDQQQQQKSKAKPKTKKSTLKTKSSKK